jgi:hypothetical protein
MASCVGWLAFVGHFPLFHRLAFFHFLPAGDHGFDVSKEAVAGCGHVQVDHQEAQDGERPQRVQQGDDAPAMSQPSPQAFHELYPQ